ncbi:MAG: hypothetical protein HY810_07180 [Candidatus Omnitrophica bacterium]|nr:hypothetical protein [Candidatus Omnitrophota bacterium]
MKSLHKSNIDAMFNIWNDMYSLIEFRRCTRCLLPETMPGIVFDTQGVCNYCNLYKKRVMPEDILLDEILAPYRKKGTDPDCIVALSGGRDSSFGLHYVKKVLGLKPVAYTHDWGLIPDIAKRNQKKMCDSLGVKHVITYENAKKIRKNLLKNIKAWLKKPALGMLPLLISADKKPYYYAHKIKKSTGIKLMVACLGHNYEVPALKMGFCNIFNKYPRLTHEISSPDKLRLGLYYFKQCLANPLYINSSLLDTLHGYASMFFLPIQTNGDVLLFKYIKWDEQEITKTLINNYGWECPSNTKLIWRMSDVASFFHSYIYLAVAGFTENDTFRSAQVRDGVMDREEDRKSVCRER